MTSSKEQSIWKASLGATQFKCGKPNCRCVKGKKHSAYYLSYRLDKKTHTVHIPKELANQVSAYCRNWKQHQRSLEKSTHKAVQTLLTQYHKRKKDQ